MLIFFIITIGGRTMLLAEMDLICIFGGLGGSQISKSILWCAVLLAFAFFQGYCVYVLFPCFVCVLGFLVCLGVLLLLLFLVFIGGILLL